MVKVLREGVAHKRWAWFGSCSFCKSELQIIEPKECDHKDPEVEHHYNCDAQMSYVDFKCPICGEKQRFHTSSAFGQKRNADYREITLTPDELEELKG